MRDMHNDYDDNTQEHEPEPTLSNCSILRTARGLAATKVAAPWAGGYRKNPITGLVYGNIARWCSEDDDTCYHGFVDGIGYIDGPASRPGSWGDPQNAMDAVDAVLRERGVILLELDANGHPTIKDVAIVYDKDYGDDRKCRCGHPYYRHFDPYEKWEPVGCKYCHDGECDGFKETA